MMTVLALASSAGLVAQETVSKLQALIGARGLATDQLGERGYTYVRTEKSDDSSYTYWTEHNTDRCVIARVSDGKIASIVYAPSSDCDSAAASTTAEEEFATVCGVIADGKTYFFTSDKRAAKREIESFRD